MAHTMSFVGRIGVPNKLMVSFHVSKREGTTKDPFSEMNMIYHFLFTGWF